MPTPLVTQHYPDDFQIVTEIVSAPASGNTSLLYADRDIVIDSITVGVNTASSVGSQTFKFSKATSPAVDATLAADLSGTTAMNTAKGTTVSVTLTNTGTATNNNLIPAGSWLHLVCSAAATAAVWTIQIRYRSRVA